MDSLRARSTDGGWHHEISDRLRAWWIAKLFGTTLGMAGFFVLYFELLRHPRFPITVMPFTAVDRLIGVQPWALPFYLSLWFYVSLAPALLLVRRELVSYGVAAMGISAIGLGIFYFWPTSIPPDDHDWSQHPGIGFLKTADATGNACPSLHVAFAVFTACWFARLLAEMRAVRALRAINWLWCVGILYSTIAVRQHVLVDAVAGAALGAIAAVAHFAWLRRWPGPAEA